MQEVQNERLFDRIAEQMRYSIGNRPGPREINSWRRSLPILLNDLVEAGLDEVEVLIEYRLPYSSKRADIVLCGSSPRDGSPSVVVIELKQWTQADPVDGANDLVKVPGLGSSPRLHPGEQVARYCQRIQDLNLFFESESARLQGAAYLHNGSSREMSNLLDRPQNETSRVFFGDTKNKWVEFLQANISGQDAKRVADQFLTSRLAPSQQLMQTAAKEVRENPQFVLLDEQQVSYSLVMRAVEKARQANAKTAVVIRGGPGSGKSVIAICLLGELSRQGYRTLHATGSRAFRNSLQKIAGERSTAVKGLFKYFNSFMNARPNDIDVLLADESHRIRATSNNRYTRKELRSDQPQIDELISAARVPVFLLDQNQVVRPGEVGTIEYIEEKVRAAGLGLESIELTGQFRCGGSLAYERWVEGLLQIDEGAPRPWPRDENFKVEVADSPHDMEAALAALNAQGYKGRLSAGYCWRWHEPSAEGELPLDVEIGSWKKPWNLKADKRVGGFLSGELWAIDPKGFEQVGCVYTSQGFEYDWSGVIFGPDLVWRDGCWRGDPTGTADPALRGVIGEEFETLIKNTYKVLLTRGLSGTYIYSVDPETQAYLKSLVPSN